MALNFCYFYGINMGSSKGFQLDPSLDDLFSPATTVIPEVSGNHCGSIERAFSIIDAATIRV